MRRLAPLRVCWLLAWVCSALPVGAQTLTVANGLAPPNPENVFDEPLFVDGISVRDVGCAGLAECSAPRNPTAIEIADGAVLGAENFSLGASETSRILISGGQLAPVRFTSVRLGSQASLRMSGGTIASAQVVAGDLSHAVFEGGLVDGVVFAGDRFSDRFPEGLGGLVDIFGGEITTLRARGYGLIRVHGGRVRSIIDASENSWIVLEGGEYAPVGNNRTRLTTTGDGQIEIVGADFTLDNAPLPLGPLAAPGRVLRGTFLTGETFEVQLIGDPDRRRILLTAEPSVGSDADGDGVPDRRDFCPEAADPENRDSDGNFIGDACNDFEDRDGDGFADALDTCPDLANPGQEDADGNGVGDLCNDAFDEDGDDFEDDIDTCLMLPNANQTDRDGDGRGDVCDPYPDDTQNFGAIDDLRMAQADLAAAEADLAMCLMDPPFFDTDGDGEHDRTDRCPGTEPGEAVDTAGCSLAQFCAAVPIGSSWGGAARCLLADWQNDETLAPRDCRVSDLYDGRVCEPRSSSRPVWHGPWLPW